MISPEKQAIRNFFKQVIADISKETGVPQDVVYCIRDLYLGRKFTLQGSIVWCKDRIKRLSMKGMKQGKKYNVAVATLAVLENIHSDELDKLITKTKHDK